MATKELPKLIFVDEDLPTLLYRRRHASEAELAVRDVDRTLKSELRAEQLELLGLTRPEEGLAAEIADLCTLDMVESIELPSPGERVITPDHLPAIPISDQAIRRVRRRQAARAAATLALGALVAVAGIVAVWDAGVHRPAEVDDSAASVPEATDAHSKIPAAIVEPLQPGGPTVVPGPALIEPVVAHAPAPRPAPRKARKKRVSSARLSQLDDLLGL